MHVTMESTEWPKRQATVALILTTTAFAICFACWVINAMLVTYLVQNGVFDFSAEQIGWLMATPILTGAISRVPLGILTDRYGGRIVLTILLFSCAVPMYMLSHSTSYMGFLICSLGFGFVGGGFAVGVGYVSSWYPSEKQGTALGIFGMGNAGAAITSLAAPSLLTFLSTDADPAEAWRRLPQLYAAVLVIMGLIFFFGSKTRLLANAGEKSLAERLSPLKSGRVWRFGLYYALVFGSFVAISQWLVPYSVNVYQISLAEAGMLAAVFTLPSGIIRALGGWLSDRYGARWLMQTVFLGCAISSAILAIPQMDILSPGVGISAKMEGVVEQVSVSSIVISGFEYPLKAKPDIRIADTNNSGNPLLLPALQGWQEANVSIGDQVAKDQLIARGVLNAYYPANIWVFVSLVFTLGVLTGVGKAGVFKYIPDYFPDNVGTVGGIVGLIGALGGFALPMVFGYLLAWTGLWTTCWIVLAILSLVCFVWLQAMINRIMKAEAPNLANLIENSATRSIPVARDKHEDVPKNVEELLQGLPFFHDLTHEALHAVATIGDFQSIPAGAIIFEQGDPGDALYVLITGKVKLFLNSEEEKRIELAELDDGAYFGDLALIDGQVRSAGAETAKDCEFFLVGRKQFLGLMSDSPRILADVLVGLSEHIRNTNRHYVDINEKKERLETQAELARHQSIAQMVAGVAHEINTPLGIVNHAASIITDDLNEDTIEDLAKDDNAEETLEALMEAGKLIQANIARADKLITSFKNLSVRQITEQREEVSLGEVIEDVLRLYGVNVDSAKMAVEFSNDSAGDDLWEGYPGPLSQVLLNILSNADRYAYPDSAGGRVQVSLQAAAPTGQFDYVISVKDFGVGIKEANQEKVFEAFYTTGRGKGGSGIGLSIVYNLVTFQLDGKIDLESTEGEGSEFLISLPRIVKEKNEQTHLTQGDGLSL